VWFIEKLNTPLAVVIVLVLFLVADGFLLYRYQQSMPDSGDVSATQPDTGPATAPTEGDSASLEQEEPTTTAGETTTEGTAFSPAATGVANVPRVVVRVVGAPAWIRVQEDGRTVLAQQAPAGFSRGFQASREVRIETGNAGAIRVEANGQDLGPLGARGEVGVWTFRAGPAG
jgi:hypothetical protein